MLRSLGRAIYAFALVLAGLMTGIACGPEATGGAGGSAGAGQGGEPPLPDTFDVAGVVVDREGSPVEGAYVMQGGSGDISLTTGADGTFALTLTTTSIDGIPTVVAGKIGYRQAGEEFYEVPADPIQLMVARVDPPDNWGGYDFGDPGTGIGDPSTAFCGHCHAKFTQQWFGSAHHVAASDVEVQDLYSGVANSAVDAAACAALGGVMRTGKQPGTEADPILRCYVGGGLLPELNPNCGASPTWTCDDPAVPAALAPAAFGGCADCHAPGMTGAPAGGRDLLQATELAYADGVHCDVCHKVREVDPSKPPGVAGRLVLQRPHEKQNPSRSLLQAPAGDVRPAPRRPERVHGG